MPTSRASTRDRRSHASEASETQPHAYLGFAARAASRHNIATWLQAAGYRTVHVGKVMNGYGEPPHDDGTSVPPGWDAWYGTVNQDKTHHFYGYRMNANGTIVGPFGDPGSLEMREYGIRDEFGCPRAPRERPCNHITDVFTRIATAPCLEDRMSPRVAFAFCIARRHFPGDHA